jgi:penicillin-binding protein 1C
MFKYYLFRRCLIRKKSGTGFILRILLTLCCILFFSYLVIPSGIILKVKDRDYSSVICDSSGYPLRTVALQNGLMREYVSVDSLPDHVVDIFLVSEDKRFFSHPGVDAAAIVRSVKDNSNTNSIVSGASTVSMQCARLLQPHNGGLKGKLLEAFRALKLEVHTTKRNLLSIWFSNIPFGRNVEGLSSASQLYFDCTPDCLSIEECAVLAVIPRSPSVYAPDKNPDKVFDAVVQLLNRTEYEYSKHRIKLAILGAADNCVHRIRTFRAPQFCNYVEKNIEQSKLTDGSKIITTLNSEMQNYLEGLIKVKVEQSASHRISAGAGLAVDSKTGAILAYIGSSDYYNEDAEGQNDGVLATNQPGSTLKPFLYELALEKGFTVSEVLPDIPLVFGTEELYTPMNFNNRFSGPVRLREALASSLNVPAVYTLERVGVENFTDRLISLGFDSLKAQKGTLGTGLALGNAEVSLYELVQGYTAFADSGSWKKLNFLLDEVNKENIFTNSVMGNSESELIRDVLGDKIHRIAGFGYTDIFSNSFDVMYKTGTSSQFNNIWAAGVTPDITAGIWMGNFSGETVIGRPGSSLPADVLINLFQQYAVSGSSFEDKSEFNEVRICTLSGMKATERCAHTIIEKFVPGSEPDKCTFHTDEGLVLPVIYSDWVNSTDMESMTEHSGEITIVEPLERALYFHDPSVPDSSQSVEVKISSDPGIEYSLFLNDQFFTTKIGSCRIHLPAKPGHYELKLVADNFTQTRRFRVQ